VAQRSEWDALLREAKVARRSLYEHFGGKDGLIAAVLRRAYDEDLAWYETRWLVPQSPEIDFPVSSIDSMNLSRTRTSEAVGTSRPTFHLWIPAIRHISRPTRSGGAFQHSSCGRSRPWAMKPRRLG
jgi:AcrR family transcriptional regulator